MQQEAMPTMTRGYRALVFLLFVAGGLALFLLGNNWIAPFPTNSSTLYKWGLAGLFLALAAVLRGSRRFPGCAEIALALFIAALANVLNADLGNWLGHMLPRPGSTAEDLAIDKVSQCVPIVLAVILLTLATGHDLGSIFLKKGDLRWGLRFGLTSFAVFAVIFAGIAVLQSTGPSSGGLTASGVPLATIVAAIPWILLFVFANSVMEELWIRGVFLGKLAPVLGAGAAVLATALIFSIPHFAATYIAPVERMIFATIVFVLGLVNGAVMLKTRSLWGSVLFHAGYDLLVIIPNLVSG
jgi:membrane protease YdiL (CAAX protease family)